MTRRISKDERSLWQTVMRGVARLRAPDPEEESFENMMAAQNVTPAVVKAKKPATAKTIVPEPAPRGREVDARTMAKFRRGQMDIDATIDLHGHRMHEAYTALRGFVLLSYERGHRCLLVIHGKGMMTGEAKIKTQMPYWLSELPDVVLAHAPAKPQHGGGGASYLLLRRRR